MTHQRLLAIGLTASFALTGAAAATELKQIGTIEIPGKPLTNFDISFIDQPTGLYYFSDRSNAGVDIFDTKTDRFVSRIDGFIGAIPKKDGSGKINTHVSGPDGVVVADGAIWAGDGDSTVKIIDTGSSKATATIPSGGKTRMDEVAFDPKDHVFIGVNNNEEPPYATLISTKPDHAIIGRLEFKNATDGLEQTAYNPDDGLFYMSLPELDKDEKKGGVAVVDPLSAKLLKVLPLENCHPQGIAFGPGGNFIVGCDMTDSKEASDKDKSQTMIMNAKSGAVVAVIQGIGGADMVNYNAKNGQYYTASWYNPGGSALGVIDAKTNTLVQTIPLGGGTHSVTSSEATGHVYVPVGKTDGGDGTIHVFAPK